MKISKIFLILLIGAVMFSCAFKKKTVKIAGSTTVLPIVQAAAEYYMNIYPDQNVSVRGGGSGIGIKAIINETIDIGNASRKINKRENELIQSKNSKILETAIAYDAISIVIHKENSIKELSIKELRHIFSGKITNWNELGGDDREIVVISRDVSSGSFEVFNHSVLHDDLLKENSMRLASNNAVATTVSYTKGAIGYIGIGYINENLNVVKIDGVMPSKESVTEQIYPLIRKLYVYTTAKRTEETVNFIDFLLSRLGQDIVEEQGYIRIK